MCKYRPGNDWPSEGRVVMHQYSTCYPPRKEPVLTDISCSIKAGEKVNSSPQALTSWGTHTAGTHGRHSPWLALTTAGTHHGWHSLHLHSPRLTLTMAGTHHGWHSPWMALTTADTHHGWHSLHLHSPRLTLTMAGTHHG